MDVSVIVINYNTFDLTCACLRSIYLYTKDVRFEIILVDNASDKEDPEKFKTEFPAIRLIKSEKNLGFSKGNNLGITYATGRHLLLLNSDIELIEDSISKCVTFLDKNEKIGVVSPRLIYPDGSVQPVAERFPSIRIEILRLFKVHRFLSRKRRGKIFLGYLFDYSHNIQADSVWGAFFMVRREVVNLLPGSRLNDDFFMYGEDMAWCYEIRKTGFEVWYYAGTTAIHIHSYSFEKENPGKDKKLEMMLDNKYSFLKKRGRIYLSILKVVELSNAIISLNFPRVKLISRKLFERSKRVWSR